MPVHGKQTRVLAHDGDVSTFFRESNLSTEIDLAETSTYGNQYKTFIQGLAGASLSLSGLYDGAEGAVDEVLHGLVGVDATRAVSVFLNGYTNIGDPAWIIGGQEANYEVTSSIGDVVQVSASFQSRDQPSGKGGRILAPHVSRNSSADLGSVDNGVDLGASNNGGAATLHVTSNDHSASIDVDIEHSPDDTAWSTLASFTTVLTTVTTGQFLVIPPGTTINRYVRASITAPGTGNFTLAVSLIRSANTV